MAGRLTARAPLRVSFVGGGTDLPAWFREHGGEVVTSAIAAGVEVTVERGEGPTSPTLRAALELLEMPGPVRVEVRSDLPFGAGLGSSSSLAVALLHALTALSGRSADPTALADLACRLELEKLGRPVGLQDQLIAALGGVQRLTFGERWTAAPVAAQIAPLERQLRLVAIGGTRSADPLCAAVAERLDRGRLSALMALCGPAREALEAGDVEALGRLLHRGWELNRGLASGITSGAIDELYGACLEAGAIGGKLLGAGGAGFLLLALPGEPEPALARLRALVGERLRPYRVDPLGSRLVDRRGA